MIFPIRTRIGTGIAVLLIAAFSSFLGAQETDYYEYKTVSRDGIGKYYMGREISHVMGHQGASWLERPQRDHMYTHEFVGGNAVVTELLGAKKHAAIAVKRLQNAASLTLELPEKAAKGELVRWARPRATPACHVIQVHTNTG